MRSFISRYGLVLILAFNFLLHLPFLNQPPRSMHVWRQCNTLAVARNYYEVDMNILYPRIDRLNETNGITGANFPAYEWLLACLYKIFGEHNVLHRLLSFGFFCLAITWMFRLLQLIFKNRLVSLLGTWLFSFSPELFYHCINALPDIPALALSLGSLVYFIRWTENKSWLYITVSALLMALAGMIKFQFLAAGFMMIGILFVSRKDIFSDTAQHVKAGFMLLLLALSVLPAYLWYKHSLALIELNNLREFGLWIKPLEPGQLQQTLVNNLTSDIPETIAGYIMFACMVLGFIYGIKKTVWKNSWFIPLLLWLSALLVYYAFAIERMLHHSYYFMPFIPVFTITAASGIVFLLRYNLNITVYSVLVLSCLLTCLRIIPSRWLGPPGVPEELYNANTCKQLQSVTNNNIKCVVGPDISGCIYFYYLHKKGYSWEKNSELIMLKENGRPYIENMISNGVKYLYTSDRTVLQNDTLKKYLSKPLKSLGGFEVWELKAP